MASGIQILAVGVLVWRSIRVSALYTIQRLLLSDAESNPGADHDGSGDSDDASDFENTEPRHDQLTNLIEHGENRCNVPMHARQSTLSANIREATSSQNETLVRTMSILLWVAALIFCQVRHFETPKTKIGSIRRLRMLSSARTGQRVAICVAAPFFTAGVLHSVLATNKSTGCAPCTAAATEHFAVLLLALVFAGPLLALTAKLVNGVSDAFTVVIELKSITAAFFLVTCSQLLLSVINNSDEQLKFASETLGIAFALFCVCFSLLFPARESFREKFAVANAEAAAGALISSKSLSAFEEAALLQEGSDVPGLSAQDLTAWQLGWAGSPGTEQIVSYLVSLRQSTDNTTTDKVMEKIYSGIELGSHLQVLPSGTLVLESALSVESPLAACRVADSEGTAGYIGHSHRSNESSKSGSSTGSGSYVGFGSASGESFLLRNADFTSPTLSLVLYIPKLRKLFKAYLRNEFSAENLLFWEKVETLKRIHRRVQQSSAGDGAVHGQAQLLMQQEKAECERVIGNFIEVGGPLQVNISATQRRAILTAAEAGNCSVRMFDKAHDEIFNLMQRDGYSRFKSTSDFALGLKRAELQLLKRKRRHRRKKEDLSDTQSQEADSVSGSGVFDGGNASDERDPFSKPADAGQFSSKTGGAAALDVSSRVNADDFNPFANPPAARRFSTPKSAKESAEADAFSNPSGRKSFSSPKSSDSKASKPKGTSAKVAPAL